MSLLALTNLAVERDAGKPKKRPSPKRRAAAGGVSEEKHTYADALVSAVPTEVLGLYTFVVTEIVGTITAGDDKRLTLRWWIYAAGIVAIVVYLIVAYVRRRHSTRKRTVPGLEIFAATVAFAAWGLVMAGSPTRLDAEQRQRTHLDRDYHCRRGLSPRPPGWVAHQGVKPGHRTSRSNDCGGTEGG
jgi:hypothetical protein